MVSGFYQCLYPSLYPSLRAGQPRPRAASAVRSPMIQRIGTVARVTAAKPEGIYVRPSPSRKRLLRNRQRFPRWRGDVAERAGVRHCREKGRALAEPTVRFCVESMPPLTPTPCQPGAFNTASGAPPPGGRFLALMKALERIARSVARSLVAIRACLADFANRQRFRHAGVLLV